MNPAIVAGAMLLVACGGSGSGTTPSGDAAEDPLGQALRVVVEETPRMSSTPGAAAAAPALPWGQIADPDPAAMPEPQEEIVWREDLPGALREAAREGRPLFVTFRCPFCKQCSGFDAAVLRGSEELDPLLARFVTVRITDAYRLDLRLFPARAYQDFDLAWWGWFLSPQGRVYGVFGGRDHVSDETRISIPALVATLRRVLAHHYDPRRPDWPLEMPEPEIDGPPRTPERLAGWESWEARGTLADDGGDCLHCHQVAEILRQPAIDAGSFDKERDLEIWPFPENVGIRLERDHGLRVGGVEPESPAWRAGLRPGDVLVGAGRRRLFGQADFRAFLHDGPRGGGTMSVVWLRDGEVTRGDLEVSPGWRRTILDWRMSVSGGNIGPDPGFFPLPVGAGLRRRLELPAGTMAVKPYVYGAGPREAGLEQGQVIVAVDGQRPDLEERAFLVWFRQSFEPGQTARLTVLDPAGRSRRIEYELRRVER